MMVHLLVLKMNSPSLVIDKASPVGLLGSNPKLQRNQLGLNACFIDVSLVSDINLICKDHSLTKFVSQVHCVFVFGVNYAATSFVSIPKDL